LCRFRFRGVKINAGKTSRAFIHENGARFSNDC
jgi:hypothetical protein